MRRLPLLPRNRPPTPPHDNNVESKQAESAAANAAQAFHAFKHWLETDLPSNDAYSSGAEAFDMMLQKGHCLDMNADEVEAYALGPAS